MASRARSRRHRSTPPHRPRTAVGSKCIAQRRPHGAPNVQGARPRARGGRGGIRPFGRCSAPRPALATECHPILLPPTIPDSGARSTKVLSRPCTAVCAVISSSNRRAPPLVEAVEVVLQSGLLSTLFAPIPPGPAHTRERRRAREPRAEGCGWGVGRGGVGVGLMRVGGSCRPSLGDEGQAPASTHEHEECVSDEDLIPMLCMV